MVSLRAHVQYKWAITTWIQPVDHLGMEAQPDLLIFQQMPEIWMRALHF